MDPTLFFRCRRQCLGFHSYFLGWKKWFARCLFRFARVRRMGFWAWAQRHRKQWKPSPGVEWPRTGGGRGYEKTKSNGGGSYGGEGSGALTWGLQEWYTGMKKLPISSVVRAVGTPLLAQGIRAGRRLGFEVTGDFALDANASISVIGGSGDADMDSSGAGGSGGSISIKAANIFNGGRLLAMGGNAFGLGGPGAAAGSLFQPQVFFRKAIRMPPAVNLWAFLLQPTVLQT